MTKINKNDNFKLKLIRSIEYYYDPLSNRYPFMDWAEKLPKFIQGKIDAYIIRVTSGGAKKNIKALGSGIFEIKINCGPGYRVYFAQVKGSILLLLIGGKKSSQINDIKKANEYWRLYNEQI